VIVVILWAELAPGVYFGPNDVAMNVHPTSHDHQVCGINGRGPLPVYLLGWDDPSVLDPNVLYLVLDPVLRIIHSTI
jgi:hypothetical protein